jgi:predicted DNA-binding transcriptional regulator AlpA
MIATGELPRPIRFNQRLLRWPPETIRAWLAALAGEEKNPYRDGTPRPH